MRWVCSKVTNQEWPAHLCLLNLHMRLLDAVIAVANALAIDVNISNLCVVAIEDTGNFFESGAAGGKVSFCSNRQNWKVTNRVSM